MKPWIAPSPCALAVGRSRVLALFCLLSVTAVACRSGSSAPQAAQPQTTTPIERAAERGPVKLTVKLDKTEVAVPDQLTMTVTVESQLGVDAAMPEFAGLLGDFGVAKVTDGRDETDGFVRRRERVVMLESFRAGTCMIPGVTVAFSDPRPKADGSTTVYQDKAATEPIRVTVLPGLADVKGPVGLPLPMRYKLLLWAVAIVAAMVLIALAARWWRRRWRRRTATLSAAPRLLAHEWALAELDKLAAENLVARGLVQEFYYRINALLRQYIERRFDLMAGEQTSEEFLRALRPSASFDSRHKEVLQRFVAACDPVKYARHAPMPGEINWVQAAARDFVHETAERATEEPRASAPAVPESRAGQEVGR